MESGAWSVSEFRISEPFAISAGRGVPGFRVAIQEPRTDLKNDRGAQPHLPMGEETGADGETAREVQIGGQLPDRQGGGGNRGGIQQRGRHRRQPLVPAASLSQPGAFSKTNSYDHGRASNHCSIRRNMGRTPSSAAVPLAGFPRLPATGFRGRRTGTGASRAEQGSAPRRAPHRLLRWNPPSTFSTWPVE